MVITRSMLSNGYITKFPIGSIDYNTDFTTSTALSMTALSSGTDDIVTDSGQTIGSAGVQSVTTAPYTNITVTYTQVSNTCYSTSTLAAINMDSNLISTADDERNTYISLLVVSVSWVVVLNVFYSHQQRPYGHWLTLFNFYSFCFWLKDLFRMQYKQ